MLNAVNELLWGPGTLALLLGTGVFLTVRMRLLPWRRLGFALRSALGREARRTGRDGVSPFSALMTALAASIGTGNIVGVATALAAGGPGALVWMELSALFGMATIFAESFLAVRYRRRDRQGQWVGGPMYALEAAFGRKHGGRLGAVFALFAVGASLGIGSMTQSNSIAGALESTFGLPVWTVGAVTAGLALVIILGGIRSISKVAAVLVPVMGVIYLAAGLAVIIGNLGSLPGSVAEIIRRAFSPRAAAGGTAGWLVAARWGVARGVFSNEAGLGSAPMAHAASDTQEPVEQGMWGVFEVFVDTIVICTLTSMAILLSGVLEYDLSSFASNGAAAAAAFNAIFPGTIGGTVLQISLLFFALSTILGWSYYGERCWGYLSNNNKVVNVIFKIAFVLMCVVGSVGSGTLMWNISDTLNGMMAIPNLVGLLLLSGTVIRLTREYFDKK